MTWTPQPFLLPAPTSFTAATPFLDHIKPRPDIGGWELRTDYYFRLLDRTWMIRRGYTWDGASVPTLLGITWRVTYSKHDPIVLEASLRHDALCDHKPAGTTSVAAADDFYETVIRNGGSSWRAGLMRKAINLGGPKW